MRRVWKEEELRLFGQRRVGPGARAWFQSGCEPRAPGGGGACEKANASHTRDRPPPWAPRPGYRGQVHDTLTSSRQRGAGGVEKAVCVEVVKQPFSGGKTNKQKNDRLIGFGGYTFEYRPRAGLTLFNYVHLT